MPINVYTDDPRVHAAVDDGTDAAPALRDLIQANPGEDLFFPNKTYFLASTTNDDGLRAILPIRHPNTRWTLAPAATFQIDVPAPTPTATIGDPPVFVQRPRSCQFSVILVETHRPVAGTGFNGDRTIIKGRRIRFNNDNFGLAIGVGVFGASQVHVHQMAIEEAGYDGVLVSVGGPDYASAVPRGVRIYNYHITRCPGRHYHCRRGRYPRGGEHDHRYRYALTLRSQAHRCL